MINLNNNRRIKKLESNYSALFGASIAGLTESTITYPLEYLKTRLQFKPTNDKPTNLFKIARITYLSKSYNGFYEGLGPVVIGSLAKSIVRFGTYDQLKNSLSDSDGKITGPKALIAGIGTGIIESIIVVTPFETIKTKIINESMSNHTGNWLESTKKIINLEGIGGIYKGLFPTMMRQVTGSAIRFTTYSTLKSLVSGSSRPNEILPSGITFGLGATSGILTVLFTQPLDVIKTRMQSLDAKTQYRNSFHCSARIFSEEGFLTYWKGVGPRSARTVISGGILFVVYEKVISILGSRTP